MIGSRNQTMPTLLSLVLAAGIVGCTGKEPDKDLSLRASAVVPPSAHPRPPVDSKPVDVSRPPTSPNLHRLTLLPAIARGLDVELGGSVDEKAAITRMVWDWGDGTKESESWFPGKHRYVKPGKYRVRVTSYDELGNTSTTITTVTWVGVPTL